MSMLIEGAESVMVDRRGEVIDYRWGERGGKGFSNIPIQVIPIQNISIPTIPTKMTISPISPISPNSAI